MSEQVFKVQGMSCGHCVKAVTQAISAVDAKARVTVELSTGEVQVQSEQPRERLAQAIEQEGYTVTV